MLLAVFELLILCLSLTDWFLIYFFKLSLSIFFLINRLTVVTFGFWFEWLVFKVYSHYFEFYRLIWCYWLFLSCWYCAWLTDYFIFEAQSVRYFSDLPTDCCHLNFDWLFYWLIRHVWLVFWRATPPLGRLTGFQIFGAPLCHDCFFRSTDWLFCCLLVVKV